ncbi:Ferritin-like domain-containing protein [Mycolicibacterium rutilum]|uniref:Ferritin-like domain-containing protein n=1 Tax=Mycolicibacterium rutilum TaxID=370526 RepID=A0A1H6L470_MYCRU|nr:ferritin-like domain-containing protein [Mycolicibacterium rutilum]SEH81020.1 Ferritin-like domain-containing protein [Mycolicibacterium rutilum]
MGEFAPWVRRFEDNAQLHARADAAIGFDERCSLPDELRTPLIDSVRRFQLGESGDGEQLLAKSADDPEYRCAAELFVAEEQQHAELLLRLLGYLGGQPMAQHWSDAVFVRLRRLMGLRTELMVLTVAEVVALSYYGGLASACPDPVVRAAAARILADERAHVRFHEQRLRGGFADSSAAARALACTLWWITAIGATAVVAYDHGRLLAALGYRRHRFARDILGDFAKTVRAVLAPR